MMNEDQTHIWHDLSTRLLNNPDINKFRRESKHWSGTTGFSLSNSIAHYSLAADRYYTTNGAYLFLSDNKLIDESGYVLRGCKNKTKSAISWEHAVPSCVIRDYFLDNIESISKDDIKNVLEITDYVVAVCKEDNDILTKNGYRCSMPKNWKLFEDSWSGRYKESKIEILDFTIPMRGVVSR